MKPNLDDVLDFFFWGLEVFSRRDCVLILTGLRQCESDWQANQRLARWERRQWIKRKGRGANACFAVTATGAKQRRVMDPAAHWHAVWDGQWRLFTYDLPEKRRSERVRLWRALHAHKLGWLQRSVWVWPHAVESILQDVLQATGIPKCFCGLAGERLLLCTDTELVCASWDFQRIGECHRDYIAAVPRFLESLQSASNLQEIARVAGSERAAYDTAFSLDPLLPRRLWPKSYAGPAVLQRHTRFRSQLRRRTRALGAP